MADEFVLSIDVDWAPDFAIEFVAKKLKEKRIKATWFLTHDSAAVKQILENNEIFECGIHPNFLPNSSHGKNEKEVMDNITRLFPGLNIVRTHALFQSTYLMKMLVKDFKMKIDVSLLLPETPYIQPHTIYFDQNNEALIRVPFFWEDDIEMYNPLKNWRLKHPKFQVKGLKVFDFHPIHIFLNSTNMIEYEKLKLHHPLNSLNEEDVRSHVNKKSEGVNDLFDEICDFISSQQGKSFTISEIVEKWKSESSEYR